MNSITVKGFKSVRSRSRYAPRASLRPERSASTRQQAGHAAQPASHNAATAPAAFGASSAAAAGKAANMSGPMHSKQPVHSMLPAAREPTVQGACAGRSRRIVPSIHLKAALVNSYEVEVSDCTSGSDADDTPCDPLQPRPRAAVLHGDISQQQAQQKDACLSLSSSQQQSAESQHVWSAQRHVMLGAVGEGSGADGGTAAASRHLDHSMHQHKTAGSVKEPAAQVAVKQAAASPASAQAVSASAAGAAGATGATGTAAGAAERSGTNATAMKAGTQVAARSAANAAARSAARSAAAKAAPSMLGLSGGLAALLVLLPGALLLGKLAAVPGATTLAAVASGGLPGPLVSAGTSLAGMPIGHKRGTLQQAHAATSANGGPGPAGAAPTDDQGLAEPIRLVSVVNAALQSPYKGASWGEVMAHTVQRLVWSDERFQMRLFTQQELKEDGAARAAFQAAVPGTPIFFGIGITDPAVADLVAGATAGVPSAMFYESAPQLNSATRVDGYVPAAPTAWQRLAAQVGWSREGRAAAVMETLQDLWGRYTSDDLLFMWLVLLNEYTTTVPSVANTAKGIDLPSLQCMLQNCASQIFACVTDPQCKAGLDCLQSCAFNDQVAQYRCVASHESPKFEAFALCVLQLHNCRGLTAAMPMKPDPVPMSSWRGAPMTHEAAEDLFLGHWQQVVEGGKQRYSWLVAGGKNPAYDAFPCQHQLFYKGKKPGVLWYEPVFKVNTLDGRQVWRRRKYRVRRGKVPGTFHLSALDNGVTSNEFWRILDCADVAAGGVAGAAVPEWCLFYYSGAAAAAGLSYNGAVLGTADGLWPGAQHTERIELALDRAGIKPFELSSVDNSECSDAPLHALGLAAA